MAKIKFNNDWYFVEQPISDNFKFDEKIFGDLNWGKIDIPHDWLIYDTKHLYRDSEGWYKKTVLVADINRSLSLYFDGVYQDSQLYLNGVLVGEWKNGYTAFEYDITKYLVLGENNIFLRVKHQSPNSRWYSGAGIYRDVTLIDRPTTIHLKTNGIYTHVEQVDEALWKINILTEIENEFSDEWFLEHQLIKDNVEIARIKISGIDKLVSSVLEVSSPQLWSVDSPNLYVMKTILKSKGLVDEQTLTIGFRNFEIHPNDGFFLNGQPIKLHGVCLHHDLGALGSAFNKSAQKRLLMKMKNMGVNAIRTAHNPAAEGFLELADEMGFIVQSEFTDVWKNSKTKFDYARFFDDWYEKDVESWIKRDRNHPCVFMWSIGNEIYDTHGRSDGEETAISLIELVHKYDSSKNAVVTFGSNYLQWESTQKVADLIKVVGYNYGEQLYDDHHKKYPDWNIYGSETLSTVSSRGVYHFPLSQSILSDDDFQCSSLGNSSTSWGAKNVEWALTNDRDTSYSLGQFLWTGVDYIGEPTPYHTKNSYLGQVDTAGFEKDSFYVIQSFWRSYLEIPVVHIFPYWDFSYNQIIDVRVVANTPKIALYFNSKLIDVRKVNLDCGEKFVQNWQIPFKQGELIARGLGFDDEILVEDKVTSFSDAASLKLTSEKTSSTYSQDELIFVEIQALDINGREVANANNRVSVKVEGPGRLVGLDNGDSTDFDEYKGDNKKLFSGRLLAIVALNNKCGVVSVVVTSPTITQAKIDFNIEKISPSIGCSNGFQEIISSKSVDNISVRKIELSELSYSDDEIIVKALIFPKYASKQKLFWRLTDLKGIDSQIAELDIFENIVKIKPKANGTFYLRCGVKNDKSHLDFYSSTSYTISNLKDSQINPYSEVSGGLFNRSNVELTNGNERGFATLRGVSSYIVFDNVDFGKFGSNELELALFSLEENDFEIQIWLGYPEASSSEMIDKVTYTMGSIWNTYQVQKFKLKNKVKGVQTIGFVFFQKVHFRDFKFIKQNQARQVISITDYDLIYGDSFKEEQGKIEKIGNNVTIQFNEMDFGENGCKQVNIYGRAREGNNAILIKRTSENNSDKKLIEFPKTEEYSWKKFLLPIMKGKQKVEFVFLPGSNFDFKQFEFL